MYFNQGEELAAKTAPRQLWGRSERRQRGANGRAAGRHLTSLRWIMVLLHYGLLMLVARVLSELYLRFILLGKVNANARRRPLPLAVAHRCGGGRAPENTLAAADNAIEEGGTETWLQVDVLLTGDGVPICLHEQGNERNLERMTGLDLTPQDLHSARLPPLRNVLRPNLMCDQSITIETSQHGADGSRLCTLDEIFARVGRRTHCLVELWGPPSEALVDAVAALVRTHQRESVTVLGHPFDTRIAHLLDVRAPDVRRMFHLGELCGYAASYWMGLLPLRTPPSAQRRIYSTPLPVLEAWVDLLARASGGAGPFKRLLFYSVLALLRALLAAPPLIAYMRAHRLWTCAWLLNTPDAWSDGCALGVDGIMTDFVAGYTEWATARGGRGMRA